VELLLYWLLRTQPRCRSGTTQCE